MLLLLEYNAMNNSVLCVCVLQYDKGQRTSVNRVYPRQVRLLRSGALTRLPWNVCIFPILPILGAVCRAPRHLCAVREPALRALHGWYLGRHPARAHAGTQGGGWRCETRQCCQVSRGEEEGLKRRAMRLIGCC